MSVAHFCCYQITIYLIITNFRVKVCIKLSAWNELYKKSFIAWYDCPFQALIPISRLLYCFNLKTYAEVFSIILCWERTWPGSRRSAQAGRQAGGAERRGASWQRPQENLSTYYTPVPLCSPTSCQQQHTKSFNARGFDILPRSCGVLITAWEKLAMSGSYYKSLYPFGGEQHQQGLSFQAGEIIKVVQALPGGWWEGEKDGDRGWFPSSYVQVLEVRLTLVDAQKW